MKRSILSLLLLLSINVSAQKDTVRKVDLGVNFSVLTGSYFDITEFGEYYHCPSLTLSYKNHSFLVGPLVDLNRGDLNNFRLQTGAHLDYRFVPFLHNKRLKNYFQTRLTLVHFSYDHWRQYPFSYKQTYTYTSFITYLGYGFEYYPIKRFYLNSSFGLNLYERYRLKSHASDSGINIFLDGELAFSLGVGYKFLSF